MRLLILISLSSITHIAHGDGCGGDSIPCPGGSGCLPPTSVCDGVSACSDGSDEEQDFCLNWNCSEGYSKCPDNIQCLPWRTWSPGYPRNAFCYKASWRFNRKQPSPLQCFSGGTNSQETCFQKLNLNCSTSSNHWPCGSQPDADCLSVLYVCDGEKDCQGGEDETEDLCRGWKCSHGMSDCGGAQTHCILDRKICDGVRDCPGGEDEKQMTTSDGVDIQCGVVGGDCRHFYGRYPGANYTAGAFCVDGSCVSKRVWCDGRCDCGNCEDEKKCDDWICSDRRFKCTLNKICIRRSQVCDGSYDCGSGDRSDEHDCPCEEEEDQLGETAPYSFSRMIKKSGRKCLQNPTCFKIKNLQIDLDRQIVEIHLPEICQIVENCTFESIYSEHLQMRGREFYTHLHLPLTRSGFEYKFVRNRDDTHNMFLPASQNIYVWILQETVLRVNRPLDKTYGGIHLPVRMKYLNSLENLRVPKKTHDIQSYIKNTLRKHLGQQEIFGVFNQDEDRSYQIYLNDFFPSFTYSRQKGKDPMNDRTYEDKNIPINLTVFQLQEKCTNASTNSLNVILLLKFASSGLMKTSEKTPWTTLQPEEVRVLEDIVCQPVVVTHTLVTHKKVTFLVLVNQKKEAKDINLSFKVANQRDRLSKIHKIAALNETQEVLVLVRHVNHSKKAKENRQLMLWLYERKQLGSKTFLHTGIVRQEKYYYQNTGNISLNQLLSGENLPDYNNGQLFKLCSVSIECTSPPIQTIGDIMKAIKSRWIPANHCINIEISGNSFVLLPSVTDNFFTNVDHDEDITSLVTNEGYDGPSNIFKLLEIDITSTDTHEKDDKNEEKTFLVVRAYQNLSSPLQSKFLLHPEFYLSTALSASLHKQDKCLQDLEQGIINYYQDRCFNYIGPAENIWSSPCISDLAMSVVEALFQAQDSGSSFLNIFWLCNSYNHLIFLRSDRLSSECSFFSSSCWVLETFFLLILFSLILTIVLGNLLTVATLYMENKKTVYQFLQINLCFADILLAICGPFTTAVITILLISRTLTEEDFMDSDLFSKFQHPQEASSVGFNNVLKTEKTWLVVSGVGVSLSTTVSIITISSMAVLRWGITAGYTIRIKAMEKHTPAIVAMPWVLGISATCLFLWDFETSKFHSQAFFDPVSKITILLPSTAASLSFHIQVCVTGSFLLVAVVFTILAWVNIRQFRNMLQAKKMIKQKDQMDKRLEEERRWFYQSCAILLGFALSLIPIFTFYIISTTSHIKIHPLFDLLAWWLFFSGASFNFVIYNFINPVFRKKFRTIIAQILKLNSSDPVERGPSTKTTFFSRSRSRESQNKERAKHPKDAEECLKMIPVTKY